MVIFVGAGFSKLAGAQHAITREYGFASWAKLKTHVESRIRPVNLTPTADAAGWYNGCGGGVSLDTMREDSASGSGGMFARFTVPARRVIFFARYYASQFRNAMIETDAIESEHLLLGLIREDKGLSTRFLRIHAPVERIRKEIEARIATRQPGVSTSVDLPLSHECMRMLNYAAKEADRLRHHDIGTPHLLLGILSEETSLALSILADILTVQEIGLDEVRADVVRFMNEEST